MADKIVRAAVTGPRPTFINGVLHLPGEDAYVNLTDLGISALGDKTPGLEKHSTDKHEEVVDAPIAAVAPHAPDAPNPQGIAPGTLISGTGRLITPSAGEGDAARAPVGADSESAQRLEKAAKPAKPSK